MAKPLRDKSKIEQPIIDCEPRIGLVEWANSTTYSHTLLAGFQAWVGATQPKRTAATWLATFNEFQRRPVS